ncbi:MAG: YidC/Oxa1 family membrane protein insertase [Patescibacteria group bacterium]
MNIFSWLYTNLVYNPQVNLLQLLYNLTNDTGTSIVLLAVIVNLVMWPIFASSYINTQKIKLLQPQLKKIQDKYKKDPQESLKQTMAFNKKHNLSSGSIFITLFVQLFFATGVYFVIRDITAGQDITGNFYPFVANLPQQSLSTTAFGFIPLQASARSYIWLPLLASLLSFAYGMYTFKWSPKIKLPEKPKKIVKKKDDKALDPEALQKSMEFNMIYGMPIILFIVNFNLPAGANIYFVTVGLMSLLRQIFLTTFYSGHTEKLLEDIAKSDPQSRDDNPANNIENTADPADSSSQPTVVEFVEKESKKAKPKKKASISKAKTGAKSKKKK